MSSRVYLAAPIFTPAQLEVVQIIYGELQMDGGIEVFSPYHNSQQIFRGRKPADCYPKERAKVLSDNIEHLEWCDYLFAWVGGMGGFTDPGVVWEMGYAACLSTAPAARGQRVRRPLTIAYVDDTDERPSMNLMLAGTVDAAMKGRDHLQKLADLIAESDPEMIAAVYQPELLFAVDKEPVV